jgi:hypothetical protein
MCSCELTQPSIIPVYISCAHVFPYPFLCPTLIPFARLVSVYQTLLEENLSWEVYF